MKKILFHFHTLSSLRERERILLVAKVEEGMNFSVQSIKQEQINVEFLF